MIRVDALDGGAIARLTLDRPGKRNALTPEMLEGLSTFAAGLERSGARSALIEGAGDAFCAGFDLSLCRDDPEAMGRLLTGLSRAIRALRRAPVPVVICAHGAAIAGGCALLGGADVAVVDEGATLGYPVVRLGVSPAVTSPFLMQAVGPGETRRRLLDPELFGGPAAVRMGLAHECLPDAEAARARARELAAQLAAKPPHALRVTKRWLSEIDGSFDDETIDAALEASLELAGGPEERERLARLWQKKDQP